MGCCGNAQNHGIATGPNHSAQNYAATSFTASGAAEPGGPVSCPAAVSSEPRILQPFAALGQAINKNAADLNRTIQETADTARTQLNTQWQDVNVTCPNCRTMLKVPPNSPVFSCPCGTQLQAPATGANLQHQFEKAMDQGVNATQAATGQITQMQIIVPNGTNVGDTIQVTPNPGSSPFNVELPQGAVAGQPMMVMLPAHLVAQAPRAAPGQVVPPSYSPVVTVIGTPVDKC